MEVLKPRTHTRIETNIQLSLRTLITLPSSLDSLNTVHYGTAIKQMLLKTSIQKEDLCAIFKH